MYTNSYHAIWDGLTIQDYNENNTDANRKGFFLTPTQRKTFKITKDTNDEDLAAVLQLVFTKSALDAIRLINAYSHNRLSILPNGFQDLLNETKNVFRLAVYKQIEFTQYNRGNVVEIQNDTQYSQGTQTNIAMGADTSIYVSDRLCLDAKELIEQTGILEEGAEWIQLVTRNYD